jgi:hypothetical protein
MRVLTQAKGMHEIPPYNFVWNGAMCNIYACIHVMCCSKASLSNDNSATREPLFTGHDEQEDINGHEVAACRFCT